MLEDQRKNDHFEESVYVKNEPPFFGYNLSNLPLGDESGLRDIEVDEDVEGECDPLVEIGDELLQRPAYYDLGWTKDKRLFLRKPALLQMMEYDKRLQDEFGWRVRVVDPFRPSEVQRQGFCWGLQEVVQHRGEMSYKDFIGLLDRTVSGKSSPAEIQKISRYLQEADDFFAYVKPQPYLLNSFSSDIPPLFIAAAANLQIIPLALDRYALTPHSTGGVADIEWLNQDGKPVNIGVPVDAQGLESTFPFFEDRVATILEKKLHEAGLDSVPSRQEYYLHQVERKPLLQKFLSEAGVDIAQLSESPEYLKKTWNDIQKNRRAVVNVGKELGLEFYGLESWHVDCNDSLGGVRSKKSGLVSGGPGYAVFNGQKKCAWGNASKLWEQITS